MMKFAILVLVVGALLWWLFGRARPSTRGDAAPPKDGDGQSPEAMVVCAHCGVHLPRGDAVSDGTRLYCGDAHRLAGPRHGA